MTKSSRTSDPGSSTHLRSFQELVQQRVQRILLVSTLYDSFILSEEGRLQETLLSQYIDLNLVNVPDLTRVPTGEAALERIRGPGEFDLVIATIGPDTLSPVELKRRLQEVGVFVPVLALAYTSRDLSEFLAKNDATLLDGVFLWQGDARIFFAMVKCVEDQLNAPHDTGTMGVPAIIIVEDNVRFLSSFLPTIYAEIYRYTQKLLSEDLNVSQKLLRLRARPKVLLCHTFEEAWSNFQRYEEQILGVISDIEFPRDGELDREAGLELTSRVHRLRSDVRLVLQSSRPENEDLARSVGASFILKGSPTLLHDLRRILVERFGFGDFVFRLPDSSEVDRAHDLRTLLAKIATAPAESLAYHAGRNHFSNWLKARTEFALAERLRPRRLEDYDSIEGLRQSLLRTIGAHHRERSQAVVADFDRQHYEPSTIITRVGQGSLGGKARGIAFANDLIHRTAIDARYPDVDIVVPTSVVLSSQVFDEFIENRGLDDFALACESEDEVFARFLEEPLPREALADLEVFLDAVDFPLAVRSSSLLEDSPAQPFAGVYQTFMLPNNDPDPEVRCAQLVRAVKCVYASMFSASARSYLDMTTFRLEEEKMAVLIQRVIGRHHGSRYYPDFSGVARSYNFYPPPGHDPEHGVAAIALGLGRTVVDGAACFRFCPRYPQHVLGHSSPQETMRLSQREFYAIDLQSSSPNTIADLRAYGLDAAEKDGTLRWLGATYLPEDNRIAEGVSRPGVRLVSFSRVLRPGGFPLAELLVELLEHGERGTNGPVEIEFAGNLATDEGERAEFAFLQLRPLARSREAEEVRIEDVLDGDVVCRSTTVLGNGRIDDIQDLVVVDVKKFERKKSVEVAQIVADYNRELRSARRPYLLIGVGRWGSTDPFLGIPVTWNQIGGARVIVEAGFEDLLVEPSQGTHFFQNLTSSQVGYFTVNPDVGEGFVDWAWLAKLDAHRESGCVRWIRLERPAVVKMDGRTREGVVLKPSRGPSAACP